MYKNYFYNHPIHFNNFPVTLNQSLSLYERGYRETTPHYIQLLHHFSNFLLCCAYKRANYSLKQTKLYKRWQTYVSTSYSYTSDNKILSQQDNPMCMKRQLRQQSKILHIGKRSRECKFKS